MTKTFLLLLFFISNNIYKVNGQNLFSEIKGSKIIIEDKTFSSLSFSVGLPIKIVKKDMESHREIMFFLSKYKGKMGKISGKIMENQGILMGKNSGHPVECYQVHSLCCWESF